MLSQRIAHGVNAQSYERYLPPVDLTRSHRHVCLARDRPFLHLQVQADGRAEKVRAALQRLSLPLDHRIGGSDSGSLNSALDCLRVLHAPEEQLDTIRKVQVQLGWDDVPTFQPQTTACLITRRPVVRYGVCSTNLPGKRAV